MARKNRRRKVCFLKPGSVVLLFFVVICVAVWGAYCWALLDASRIADEIKRLEQVQREQKASLVRLTAVWNQMTEPQRLSEAIAHKGLVMNVAKPHRQIRVREGNNAFVMNDKLRREIAALRGSSQNDSLSTASTRRYKRSR